MNMIYGTNPWFQLSNPRVKDVIFQADLLYPLSQGIDDDEEILQVYLGRVESFAESGAKTVVSSKVPQPLVIHGMASC